jgi:hypothetical protein
MSAYSYCAKLTASVSTELAHDAERLATLTLWIIDAEREPHLTYRESADYLSTVDLLRYQLHDLARETLGRVSRLKLAQHVVTTSDALPLIPEQHSAADDSPPLDVIAADGPPDDMEDAA